MKVLFAVNKESISDAIIKQYQKQYREIISYKNVYYFNAILKELQRDKTYDRIVISEDLEPFANNNYDSIDKFIFEKLDSISDEALDSSGQDTSIILICTDRRTKASNILVKLFGIGIYNALIGKDRSVEEVCNLINRPRNKKEAKTYYRIEAEDVNYQSEDSSEVNELELENILAHYKKLGKNTDRYTDSFNNIAAQYNDAQLKVIINCLPMNVKAVLEAESPKYQELMTFSKEGGTKKRLMDRQPKVKPRETIKVDMINTPSKPKMDRPVVIPGVISSSKIKKNIRFEDTDDDENFDNAPAQSAKRSSIQTIEEDDFDDDDFTITPQAGTPVGSQSGSPFDDDFDEPVQQPQMQKQAPSVFDEDDDEFEDDDFSIKPQPKAQKQAPSPFDEDDDEEDELPGFDAFDDDDDEPIQRPVKQKTQMQAQRPAPSPFDVEDDEADELPGFDAFDDDDDEPVQRPVQQPQRPQMQAQRPAPSPFDVEDDEIISENDNLNAFEAPSTDIAMEEVPEVKKRGRGRPKKAVDPTAEVKPKGKRGRPKKNAEVPEEVPMQEVNAPVANDQLSVFDAFDDDDDEPVQRPVQQPQRPAPLPFDEDEEDDEADELPGFDAFDDDDDEDIVQRPAKPQARPQMQAQRPAPSPFDEDEEDDEADELPGFDAFDDDDDEPIQRPVQQPQRPQMQAQRPAPSPFDEDDDETDELPGFDAFDDDDDDEPVQRPVQQPQRPQMQAQRPAPSPFDDDDDFDDEPVMKPQSKQKAASPFDDDDDEEDDVLPTFDDSDDDNFSSGSYVAGGATTFAANSQPRRPVQNAFDDSDEQSIDSVKQRVDYSMSSLNSVLTKNKKIVTFVGTSKNGTSFLVNNLASLFSSISVKTALLDMTKNKNSYYIYTKNDENLRKIAYNSIEKLQNGFAEGIKADRNLTVFTALPNDTKQYDNPEAILSTLAQNYDLILIDCDFDTDPAFFANCQEIYLVQSMDILTIQPLTAFLRELKTKGVLEEEKLKIVINKSLKVKGLNPKLIIGGMALYNDPSMSFNVELFNRDTIRYCEIRFEDDIYSKYLETIVNCNISINKYSKRFQDSLKNLGNMVYPQLSKAYVPNTPDYSQSSFSRNMNNTLNQMKNKY